MKPVFIFQQQGTNKIAIVAQPEGHTGEMYKIQIYDKKDEVFAPGMGSAKKILADAGFLLAWQGTLTEFGEDLK